jgi:hypothetical protein
VRTLLAKMLVSRAGVNHPQSSRIAFRNRHSPILER